MTALRSDELLPALNTDVIIIILEHLLDLDCPVPNWPSGGLGLRLLSKQMNELVLPLLYRRILLGRGIFDSFKTYLQVLYGLPVDFSWQYRPPQNTDVRLKVGEYIRTYTQHIEIGDWSPHLEWTWLPTMLYHMENLKQITWSYWGPTYNNPDRSVQSKVLGCSLLRARFPKLRISAEGFYEEEAMWFHHELVDLVSCTGNIGMPMYFKWTHVIELKRMLLASPNMETFDMISKHSGNVGIDWDIRDGEKLPPFKDLTLQDICWYFSPIEAVTFWDWSRISHLRMTGVHIIDFLRTVTPEYLSGLRTFETDCWGLEDGAEEGNKLLCNLVNGIATLERLQMRCTMRSHLDRCFPAIISHGRSLRSLSLRDFHRPDEDPQLYSVLPIEHLHALCDACPNLSTLDIDIKLNVDGKCRSVLSTTLASFRNLRELELHACMPYSTSYTDMMLAWGIATPVVEPWIKDLVSAKQGLGFDVLHFSVEMRHTIAPRFSKESFERTIGLGDDDGQWTTDLKGPRRVRVCTVHSCS